jgi:hypothetical protein
MVVPGGRWLSPVREVRMTTRYAIRRGAFAPLLAALGATARASFVEVTADAVRFRFGWGFDERLPRADLAAARRARWPWYRGIGWRLWPGCIGLIGSLSGVVEIALARPRRARVFGVPWTFRWIAVSFRDPDGFLAEFRGPSPNTG